MKTHTNQPGFVPQNGAHGSYGASLPYTPGTHMVVREAGTNPVVKIGSLSECQTTVNRLLTVSPVKHRIEPLNPERWKR